MSDDTIREFEAPDTGDIERFAEFRSALVQKFLLSDEDATRIAFALSERHPALVPNELTSTHVDAMQRELAQDVKFEASLRKASDPKN